MAGSYEGQSYLVDSPGFVSAPPEQGSLRAGHPIEMNPPTEITKIAPFKKLSIVAFLYFAEGFPFGLVWDATPVFLRLKGMGLEAIGLMSLVGLPWSLKFVWAPAVDKWKGERFWIVVTQLSLAATLFGGTLITSREAYALLWLSVVAFISATQDIACDAYTIRLLEERELGMANGVRVSAYRIALIASGGVFMAYAGWIGWDKAFATGSLLMLIFSVVSYTLPRRAWCDNTASRQSIVEPLRELLSRPLSLQILVFVILYKIGDMAMGPMVRPFWVDRGLSPSEMGFITGTGGILAAIAGALAGGAFTSSFGIFRGLWAMGILQAVSNLGYAFVAIFPQTGHEGVYGASLLESFCSGLGTAPFLAFLMKICDKRWAATQYSLLSALFGLARSVAGGTSGLMASSLGYGTYFGLTFVMSLPAFTFLPWVKKWTQSQNANA